MCRLRSTPPVVTCNTAHWHLPGHIAQPSDLPISPGQKRRRIPSGQKKKQGRANQDSAVGGKQLSGKPQRAKKRESRSSKDTASPEDSHSPQAERCTTTVELKCSLARSDKEECRCASFQNPILQVFPTHSSWNDSGHVGHEHITCQSLSARGIAQLAQMLSIEMQYSGSAGLEAGIWNKQRPAQGLSGAFR